MTAALAFDFEERPRLRPEIVIGPPELRGDRTVFYVKDGATNWFFRIGVAEHFFLSRMDGSRTFAELGEAYREAAGRPLTAAGWSQLFDLLAKRQVLAGHAEPAALEELRQAAAEELKQQNREESLLQRRFKLADPDRFLERLLPFVRWVFSPWVVVPVLLAAIVAEVYVFSSFMELFEEVAALRSRQASWLLLLGMFGALSVLHELGHGLACKHFGGSVREMGVIWRYFWFFPYTKLDDIVVFHNRRHRVYTAFAGMFVTLLVLVAATVLWILAPPSPLLRGALAMILTFYNFSIFRNAVPFVKLDGYFMLSHALGMADLREESYGYWKKLLSRSLLRRSVDLSRYPRGAQLVYLGYGFFSALFTASFVAGMLYFWFGFLSRRVGGVVAAALILLLLGRVGFVRFRRWRHSRREADEAPSAATKAVEVAAAGEGAVAGR